MAVLLGMAMIPALLPGVLAQRRTREPLVSGQVATVSHSDIRGSLKR